MLETEAVLKLRTILENWQPQLVGTLVFVCQGPQVLLIHKKTGHGSGLINGPGGKLHSGESPIACARRELNEELGVGVRHLRQAATLRFVELAGDQWLGHAFVGTGLIGTPRETREARPLWLPQDALPYDRMWADDRHWLPRALSGEALEADFLFRDSVLLAADVRRVSGSGTSRSLSAGPAAAAQSAAS
ncbi:MAG: 8-oxo-dGTP diphosphatase [Pseudomonadota bacterium]